MSRAGSEGSEFNGIHLLSRRDIPPDPLPALAISGTACVSQQPGMGSEQQGCAWEPREMFLHPKHLWFLSDLNGDPGGGRKRPGKPQRRFAAPQPPVPQSWGANSPNLPVRLCKKAASKAKRRGDPGGGGPGCGAGHGEMPQRYPKLRQCARGWGWVQEMLCMEILLDFTFNWRGRRDELPVHRPMPPLASTPTPAPFCHQPPCDGDREAMAAPAPTRHPNLWLVLLIRSQGPMPRASAGKRGSSLKPGLTRRSGRRCRFNTVLPRAPLQAAGFPTPASGFH